METSAEPTKFDKKPDLNEVLLFWKSPSHPFKKRDKIFYQTVVAITFLLVVIVFFLHEFMLMGVILSVAFVIYVISSVPPIEVEHKMTRLGFENAGRFFRWDTLHSFWFEEKWGYKTLVIHTRLPFPSQIRVVLGEMSEKKVKDSIGKYLLYHEKPLKTWTDKFSDWLAKKIPLEATS